MTRVATLAQHDLMMSLIIQNQRMIDDRMTQVASGAKSQSYKGIATDSERLLNLEASHVRISRYVANNETVLRRLQTMESSIAQIYDVASEFKTLLVNGLNAQNAQDLNINQTAEQMLEHVASLLNVDDAGRYLFSGNRTDTEPVDLTGLPVAYVVPTADDDAIGYYTGDSVRAEVRADDSLTIAYGVTADEQGFERLIRAIDVVRKGSAADTTMLNHALDLINQALDDVGDIRTRVGGNMKTLGSINEKHDEFLLFAEQNVSDIENVDITQAMTEMNSAQVNLQASYMSLARLSQSSLLNFLR